jgi:hypothetical protein
MIRSVRSLGLLPALLLATAVTACSAGDGGGADTSSGEELSQAAKAAATTSVQMNDVSILLPLGKTTGDLASYLSATSQGPGGDLLPADLFSAVADQVQGLNASIAIDDLRAVAFRIDPCFAQIGTVTDASSCDHMLRIVYQPLSQGTSGKSLSAQDAGVHAFYALSSDQFADLLKGIVALRVANGGTSDLGPLAIHPIIAKQGLSGKMAQGLNALVLQYAGKSSLTRITAFLGVFAQHTSWNFAAVDVVKGKAKPSAIPALPDNTMSESVNLGTAPTGLIALTFPTPSGDDAVNPLLLSTSQEATDDARQAAFDSALRFENPDFNSPNTIDCVSCHTAQIGRQLIGEGFFKMSEADDANVFTPDSTFVSAKDFKSKYVATQPNGLSANLHAFSYDGTQPMIIQRVVNETAAIVAQVSAAPLAVSLK